MQRFEEPERLPPELRTTRYLPVRRAAASPTSSTSAPRRPTAPVRRRQRPGLPAPPRAGRGGRRSHQRARPLRRRRSACTGGPDGRPFVVGRSLVAVCCARARRRHRRGHHGGVAAAARHPPRLGQRRFWPASSGGGARECWLSVWPTGTGAPTGSPSTRWPSASRPPWPPPSRSTSWPARLAGHRRARRARRRPATVPGRPPAPSPCCGGTGSCSSSARREGFGRSFAQGRIERTNEATGVRLRRLLEDAGGVYVKLGQIAATRVDLIPPELAGELASCRTGSARAVERIQPVLEAELGAARRRGLRRVRLGAAGGGLDRPDLPARLRTGERVVVKVQRPASRTSWSADLAALGWWPTSPSGAPCSGRHAVGGGARPVRPQPPGRARLPPRGRRHGGDGDPARGRLGRAHPEGPQGAVHPAAARAGAVRRLHRRRQRSATPRAIDRAALAEDLLRSMLEQVLTVGFFHADPHPGNVFVLEDGGTLGLIDFGAVGRLDPIQQKAMVDMMAALVRRDVELLRDGVERVAEMAETVPPERLERVRAADGRPPAAWRRCRSRRSCRTSSRRCPSSGSGSRATSSSCRGPGHPRRHARHHLARGLAGGGSDDRQLTGRTTGSRGSQDGRARRAPLDAPASPPAPRPPRPDAHAGRPRTSGSGASSTRTRAASCARS